MKTILYQTRGTMKFILQTVTLGALLTGAVAAPAVAQSGFSLKAGYIYNRANLEGAERLPPASGFTLGAEYVLPLGLGVGVSAYTGGRVRDFEVQTSNLNVVGEANYFFRLPLVPVAPYAGLNASMGRYSRVDNTRPGTRPEDRLTEFGYQAGVRAQLLQSLGLDAQIRRVSSSLAATQPRDLSRTQVLIGVTLF
jgi:hypothetical protein